MAQSTLYRAYEIAKSPMLQLRFLKSCGVASKMQKKLTVRSRISPQMRGALRRQFKAVISELPVYKNTLLEIRPRRAKRPRIPQLSYEDTYWEGTLQIVAGIENVNNRGWKKRLIGQVMLLGEKGDRVRFTLGTPTTSHVRDSLRNNYTFKGYDKLCKDLDYFADFLGLNAKTENKRISNIREASTNTQFLSGRFFKYGIHIFATLIRNEF